MTDHEKSYVVDNGILGYLSGVVKGHPRLTEGHLILTSEVLAIALDKSWAVTRDTHYLLGRPDEGPADLLKDLKVQISLGCTFKTIDLRDMDRLSVAYRSSPIANLDILTFGPCIDVSPVRH
jgi:hypothetical protein